MTTDAFNRNKTREARLGELITEPGEQNQRDAVHIAVVPVVAGYNMRPGQHVGISTDGKTAVIAGPYVGIVDPFLMDVGVREGQTFWLFLYQGQVTTLRHEWTHPAFPNAVHEPSKMSESEMFLRIYAARIKPYDKPEDAYRAFLSEIKEDEMFFHGTDSDHEARNDRELMRHILNVTGHAVDTENLTIRCSR